MEENKGFTLIELLAVIVILAVIALIATPIIMNVINDAKKGAFKDSAYGIIKASELRMSQAQVKGQTYNGETIDLTSKTLSYKGSLPKAGAVQITSTGKIALEMNDGIWCITKGLEDKDITIDKKSTDCDGSSISELVSATISSPEIKDGMIPVTFDASGNTVKADINSKWYDYDNKVWANAVSVTTVSRSTYQNATSGTVISESDILGYFVWIPRYRYQLWNAENGTSNEQTINIEFEKVGTNKSNGNKNGQWLTHPAFTFGSSELSGIWVGKFELTGTADSPTVKPNTKSLTSQNNYGTFMTIRKFSETDIYGLNSYDAHMMKNMEWGAVAYLSHSKYGKNSEIWINNVNTGYGLGTAITGQPQWGPSITGCSGTSVSAGLKNNMTACESGQDYKQAGVNASTTGNITGIYDMSGGVWERTMGVVIDSNGAIIYVSSGFNAENMPDKKYYDTYTYSTDPYDFKRGLLGDATREIIKGTSGGARGWYNDYSYMPANASDCGNCSWFYRGGYVPDGSYAGAFGFYRATNIAWAGNGSRAVVVSE